MKRSEAFIGLDVHKETIAVAIADAGRDGEVRYWGTMPNTMHHLGQLVSYCQELCSGVLNQAAFCRTPSVKILPSRTRTMW